MAIVVNKPLPEFEANATGGIKVTNTSHNGKTLVLYFYPKDNTLQKDTNIVNQHKCKLDQLYGK